MRFGRLAAVLMACGLGFTATADQIKLTNGSTIIGSVEQVFEGKVKIKTDFAGDLTIDQVKIESIKTDADVNLATATGKSQAKLSEATPVAGISALWPMGAADPTLPKPPEGRKWKYEASIDITGKTGNTEKASQGAGFKATMTGPEDRLLLYVNGVHSRENHATTEKEFIFGADYEHRKYNAGIILLIKMILDAKANGRKFFDFWGVTTSEDPKHPWYGFSKFKMSFGGKLLTFTGTYDLPINKNKYRLYSLLRPINKLKRKIKK